ncbi:hypothetical protein [Citrobacter portucalensis]|uniref:hypothetical protein n=1 Tax=Citrobacter portucalensis TaxID=1639133 RepID=UPI001865E1C7|nr:hypothetical protein [Citrobacter freundii]EJD6668182.1 hypothetical protein [Citrobacter freundii]MBQ0205474.1 hypothetical protein [Citrobacter freundii]
MNFAGGAVTLIFTVERFNSAIHHREAHFCFALVARLAERLSEQRSALLMGLVYSLLNHYVK